MMMNEVRVTATNSLDVSHVAFLGFVGELAPQFKLLVGHLLPFFAFPLLHALEVDWQFIVATMWGNPHLVCPLRTNSRLNPVVCEYCPQSGCIDR